jgi:hypothetical protein
LLLVFQNQIAMILSKIPSIYQNLRNSQELELK